MAGSRAPSGERGGSVTPGNVAAAALLAVAAVSTAIAPPTRQVEPAVEPADEALPHTTKSGLLGRLDMVQQGNRGLSFGVGVVKKIGDDRAGRLAALIAYYGFFSVFPALLALVTILGFVLENNPDLRTDIADSALAQFPVVGDSIASSVASPLTGSPLALVIGLAGALWAGMGMVQACQDAMNEVWAVERVRYPSFVGKRLRSLLMLSLIGALLLVSTGLTQVIHIVAPGAWTTALLFVASILLNALVFTVAYRVLTVADVSWGMAFPGAVFAGAAYTLLQYLGGLYVNHTLEGASETYGTFATVIGLLSWIFLMAQVLMIGAEINTVRARRLWPRSLFGDPATRGDRAVHAAQATAQRMDERMVVDVDFPDPDRVPSRG
jgi:YihY family inner membrane protein